MAILLRGLQRTVDATNVVQRVQQPRDDMIVAMTPSVVIVNDAEGLQILSAEGLPVEVIVDDVTISITPEIIEVEAPDISVTAEAAEIETSDFSLAAAGVEVETFLFTVL